MRIFYLLFGLVLVLAACQPSQDTDPDPDPAPEVTITFNSEDFQDWILEDVEGANVGTIGAKDPTLTLSVGTRYTIINKDGLAHPFQLLDGFTILLSEQNEGSFANDSEVRFEDGEGLIRFTLTQNLAEVLDSYNCFLHLAMTGSIVIQ
jgi:hypothetical protein